MLYLQGDDLNKYGRLVLEDQFRVSGARDPRIFFLFEKLLLVTKRREDGEYYCKSHFEVRKIRMCEFYCLIFVFAHFD